MSEAGGKFVVIACRGTEKKKFYYEHIKRISHLHNGIVLLIDADDLDIIIRRTLNGKKIEGHVQELFDRTVREIS